MEFIGGPLDGQDLDFGGMTILAIPHRVETEDGVRVRFVEYELRGGKYWHVDKREKS